MATAYCQRRAWVVLLLLIHTRIAAQGQSPLFDGKTFAGYKLRETADEWQLRDPATSQTHRIAKADVEQSRDSGSLMPEGLTAGMTRDELHDLIRFLSDLGQHSSAR